jgi:hypothetical protein
VNCKEQMAMANEDKIIANKAPNRKKFEALLIALPKGLDSLPGNSNLVSWFFYRLKEVF